MSLNNLFEPESVAVVGASREEEKAGHAILKNLVDSGFEGDVIAVNPAVQELLGVSCYPSLAEYGHDIDLVVIALAQQYVKETIAECAKVNAKAVVVIASGFKELGPEEATLEQEIADYCKRHNMRLLGPNCLGFINTEKKLNVSFAKSQPVAGEISVFSQSGALCSVMIDLAEEHHLGLAKVISIGNKADIAGVDVLSYLANDTQTKVIIGYLEDIATGKNFVKAAEEASSKKPVIILKSGTTAAGLRAAASHTGVLATEDSAYGAVFKRSGVIRADSFEALFDVASALSMQPLPKGDNVLILTNAGGPGILAADAVEKAGLKVAELSEKVTTFLKHELFASVGNNSPIDVLGDADPSRYASVIKAAQADEAVDAILVILSPQAMSKPAETAKAISNSLDGIKPVVATFMGGNNLLPARQALTEAGLPHYPSPERAVTALKGMSAYANWKKRPPRMVTRFRVNRRRVERILSRRQRTGRLQLGEVKGKDVLGAYGFHVPDGALASSAEEAREIAERIGFPVAMKIVSPDIVHKSDLGGVFLNVANGEAADDSYELMNLKIRKKMPDARIEGVYVEKMISKGLEVIIGMTRDPQFGPMLMFGLGGIFVEVMKDITFHLAPITEQEAIQMLKSTKSYAMLQGRRGQEGVDLAAIASGLQRISQLTTDFPQILELDINPFIVGDFGSEPIVADVRMSLAALQEKE
ncbi:MAG: CoA-binding protein [Desulfocapsa sp.]|nr:MAG: CoA-binding protein [Desulfocapsa sp.]